MYEVFESLRDSAMDPDQIDDLLIAAIAKNLDTKIRAHVFKESMPVRSSVYIGHDNLGPDGMLFPAACSVRIFKRVGELGALRLQFLFSVTESAREELMEAGFPSLYPNGLSTVSITLSQPIEVKGRGRPALAPPTVQVDVSTGNGVEGTYVSTFNITTNDSAVSGGMFMPLSDLALSAWNDICIILIETFFLHCAQGSVFGLIAADASALHSEVDGMIDEEEDEDPDVAPQGMFVDGPFTMVGDFLRLSSTLDTLRESGVTLTSEIIQQVSRKVYFTARDQMCEIDQKQLVELLLGDDIPTEKLQRLVLSNPDVFGGHGLEESQLDRAQLHAMIRNAHKKFSFIALYGKEDEECNSDAAFGMFLSDESESEEGWAAGDENYALEADEQSSIGVELEVIGRTAVKSHYEDPADLDDFDEEEEVLEMMEEEEEDDEAPSKDPAPNPIPRRNVRLVQTVRMKGFKK